MFTSAKFRRQNDPGRSRRPQGRHPQVEGLDGRLLLSGVSVTSEIVGAHPGTPSAEVESNPVSQPDTVRWYEGQD